METFSSPKSFWTVQESTAPFPVLKEDLKVDVLVIGAGFTGLLTAYELALEGREVVVLDKTGLAGGESAYTTAHLTAILDARYHELIRLHGEENARLVLESHSAGIDRLEAIVKKEKIACDFLRVPGKLVFKEKDNLEEEFEAFKTLGMKGLSLDSKSLIIPKQAQFHPLKFLKGLHEVLVKKGVRFYTSSVQSVREYKTVLVRTANKKKIWARHTVVATHTPINDRFSIHTKIAPYLSYVLAAKIPKNLLPYELVWDTEDPYHYVRLHPLKDSDLLIVGGEDHKTGQEKDTHQPFLRLQRWVLDQYPVVNRLDYYWSGQVMESMDGLAFIGKNPGNRQVYIATGYSGNGLTYAALSSLLISDLIVRGKNPWEETYRSSRKNWKGASSFIKENLNVACQILKAIPGVGVTKLEDIPAGEGGVIQRGVKKLAIYKEPDGKVNACSAVCPHLGCIVAWNQAEACFDCPCHGSRFDKKGKVMHGPSFKGLKKVKLGN